MNRPDLDAIQTLHNDTQERRFEIEPLIAYVRELEDNLHRNRHQTQLERIAELIEIENHLTGTSFAAYEQIQELRKRIRELEAGENV